MGGGFLVEVGPGGSKARVLRHCPWFLMTRCGLDKIQRTGDEIGCYKEMSLVSDRSKLNLVAPLPNPFPITNSNPLSL